MTNSSPPTPRRQRLRGDRAESRILAFEWAHNSAQRLRASIVTIGGKEYVDIRKYLKTPTGLTATAKGLTIPVQELDQLALAVAHLKRLRAAIRRGLQ